jgi:hypothetical protein
LTLKFCPNSTILCQNRHFSAKVFFLIPNITYLTYATYQTI